MKTNLRGFINEMEISLVRNNGEWALSVKGKPSAKDIKNIKAQKEEIISELKRIKEENLELQRKEKENTNIVVGYMEGENLSGYVVKENAEMMVELGLAKMVTEWGYLVKSEVIEVLGTEFTVEDAIAYIENNKTEKTKEENTLESKIETARVLGHKVVIKRYSVKCDGTAGECNTDIITEYVDRKGEITKTRVHTH